MEERIWGVYNTFDNQIMISELSEIDLWKKIDNLENTISWMKKDIGKPYASKAAKKVLLAAEYNLEFLIYSTQRFGVEFSNYPSSTVHVERSDSYNTWFNFWYHHFSTMHKAVYDQFVYDKTCGRDISGYMPSGNWKDKKKISVQKILK